MASFGTTPIIDGRQVYVMPRLKTGHFVTWWSTDLCNRYVALLVGSFELNCSDKSLRNFTTLPLSESVLSRQQNNFRFWLLPSYLLYPVPKLLLQQPTTYKGELVSTSSASSAPEGQMCLSEAATNLSCQREDIFLSSRWQQKYFFPTTTVTIHSSFCNTLSSCDVAQLELSLMGEKSALPVLLLLQRSIWSSSLTTIGRTFFATASKLKKEETSYSAHRDATKLFNIVLKTSLKIKRNHHWKKILFICIKCKIKIIH